jgi:hypothetical protein
VKTSRPLNPAELPIGTEVWPYRVLGLSGRGTYGTVYRAEKVGHEHEGPVALKVAKYPFDPRFEREGEVLSRMRHPNVPRLLDRGWWRGPDGQPYPFLVMEWVEGVGLYGWAEQPGRTWGQGVRVLAQVASALAATHAVEGVHRDVKGENVLVREDGSAVLVDFGSADWMGARTLTRPGEPPPGTPQYWSPESLRFQWEKRREREAHYEAGPADDVYALGMMAWRLVVGRYPEAVPAPEDLGEGDWLSHPVRLPPQALAGAGRELKGVILRMLVSEPQARGSAAEALQALERVEQKAGPKAERPLRASSEPASAVRSAWAVAVEWTRERRRALLVAAAAMVLAVGVWSVEPQLLREWGVEVAEPTPEEGDRDRGTSEVADTAVTGSESAEEGKPRQGGFSLEVPKDPRPGQLRPPCNPPRVAINGGCWRRQPDLSPPCDGDTYVWGDGCYWPVMITSRVPTSEPR